MSYGTVQAEKMTTESGYSLGAGNASSFKNRIINGGMVIDQRNNGSAVTISSGAAYPVDRWFVEDGCDAVFSVQRSTDVPAGRGFTNSLQVTTTTADASIGSNQFAVITQIIEGFNSADLNFGTANAVSCTVSFWVKATVTGQYSCTIYNNGSSRINPQPFTVNSSNTWEQKTVTFTGDTSGTWLTNNGRGVVLNFYIAMGSSFLGAAGWNGSNIFAVTGQANAVSAVNNIFSVTGVQLEVGTVATSFDFRDYGRELIMCQRYFQQVRASTGHVDGLASGVWRSTSYLPVVMRATPTLSLVGSPNYLLAASTNRNLTGFSANYSIQSIVQFDGTFSSTASGTNGFPATMTTDSAGYTTYIAASAEI